MERKVECDNVAGYSRVEPQVFIQHSARDIQPSVETKRDVSPEHDQRSNSSMSYEEKKLQLELNRQTRLALRDAERIAYEMHCLQVRLTRVLSSQDILPEKEPKEPRSPPVSFGDITLQILNLENILLGTVSVTNRWTGAALREEISRVIKRPFAAMLASTTEDEIQDDSILMKFNFSNNDCVTIADEHEVIELFGC